jgi:hypothetical protein
MRAGGARSQCPAGEHARHHASDPLRHTGNAVFELWVMHSPAGAGEGGGESVYPGSGRHRRADRPLAGSARLRRAWTSPPLAPTPDNGINPASVFPPPAGAGEGGGESVYPGSLRLRRARASPPLAPTPDSEINPASVFPPPAGAGEGGGASVYPGSLRLRRADRLHEPIPELSKR